MSNKLDEALSYDDVLLIPQYSDIRSRTEVSTATDLGKGLVLNLPIIASPMDTISESAMAIAIGNAGGTAIIHRYNGIEMQSRMVSLAQEVSGHKSRAKINIGGAVGISGDFIERAQTLLQSGATFLCIDVAHGHHILMQEAIEKLRMSIGEDVHIMAGNVATLEGINDLADWGADSVRCNIGGGSICSTRVQTGHGVPGLQTVIDCSKTDRKVTVIADGGIRNSGKEAQVNWRGIYSSYEGVSARVPYRGSVVKILEDLERGIRSGLSYSGARSIAEFQSVAKMLRQTSAGMGESKTHILGRQW